MICSSLESGGISMCVSSLKCSNEYDSMILIYDFNIWKNICHFDISNADDIYIKNKLYSVWFIWFTTHPKMKYIKYYINQTATFWSLKCYKYSL